jgi:FkbM family methyltransferase
MLTKVLSDLLGTDIGRRRPIGVLWRFTCLNIRKRLTSGKVVFKTISGSKAFVQRGVDTSGASGLFYTGFLELHEVVCLWHLLREGDIFFDIGANQGAWGLCLAPKGVVCHEFEPSQSTFASLQKQIQINSEEIRSLITPHCFAVSDQNGECFFTTGLGQANHLLVDEFFSASASNQNFEKVQVVTLDSIGEAYGVPTAIKIDTEGFTNEVLKGGRVVLADPRLRVIVIEAFRFADGLTVRHLEVESILASYNFYPYDYDPSGRHLRRLLDPLEGRQDTLYLRASQEDLDRLRSSEPIEVCGISF